MERLRPHEEVKSSLVQWNESLPGKVIFISHTWLRFSHPDSEDGQKFKLLQHLLVRAIGGELEINAFGLVEFFFDSLRIAAADLQADLSDGYVWLDFMSIPQAAAAAKEQGQAIDSINSYIRSSSYFMCLAGPWRHENGSYRDVMAWSQRGWCRLEMLSNALSPNAKPIIVAQSPSDVLSWPPVGVQIGTSLLQCCVGKGKFTVSSDALKLGPVIASMIAERKALALERGGDKELQFYRFLHACTDRMLEGCEVSPPAAEEAEGYPGDGGALTASSSEEPSSDEKLVSAWLAEMRFDSVADGDASGYTPLRFAALSRRTDVAAALIRSGAALEAPLAKANAWLALEKGMAILHHACMSGCDPSMAELLLNAKANPDRRVSGTGAPILYAACTSGNTVLIDFLLARCPEQWLQAKNVLGEYPGPTGLGIMGRDETIRHMFEAHPQRMAEVLNVVDDIGCTFMVWASMSGSVPTMQLLLDHGADPQLLGTVRNRTWRFFSALARALFWLNGKRKNHLYEHIALYSPAMPIHLCCGLSANLGGLELLLAHAVDVNTARSAMRMTALHFAAMNGHTQIVERLLEAGANPSIRDAYGRTAATWAAKRGHHSIAQRLRPTPSPSRPRAATSWSRATRGDQVLPAVAAPKESPD